MFRNLNNYQFNYSFYFLFILIALSFPFFFIPDVSAATQASLRWEPNTEPDLAGYRIFHREQNQSYDYAYPSWEGTDTYCTIYYLDESKTYFFVARAFDSEGYESENSIEAYLEPEIIINEPPTAVVTPNYIDTTEDTLVILGGSASTGSDYVMQNEPPILDSVTITGPVQINESSGAQYILTANYSDGSNNNVTDFASWRDNSRYAGITSYGNLITSSVVSAQSCMITASYEDRSDTHNVTIVDLPQNHSPAVDFSFSNWRTITIFRERSTDSDGSVVSWLWDFGDGKHSTRRNPWHRYGRSGNYSVTLTVTDNEGVGNSISKTVSITRLKIKGYQ